MKNHLYYTVMVLLFKFVVKLMANSVERTKNRIKYKEKRT
jgi:hypothetical protein